MWSRSSTPWPTRLRAVDVLGHSLAALALRAAAPTSNVRRLVLYEPAIIESPQPPELVAQMQAAVEAGRYEDVVELMMRKVLDMPEAEIPCAAGATQLAGPGGPPPATLPREESVSLVWTRQRRPR